MSRNGLRNGMPLGLLMITALFVACQGKGDDEGSNPPQPTSPQSVTDAINDDIRTKLEPTCIGCHASGSNKPFFANAKSFADLLAYNPLYVTPGHPEQSELIALLEGQGTKTYKQMPIAGDSFEVRASRGETKITTQQVKDWISKLVPRKNVVAAADPAARTVRRMTADQVRLNLYDQLGLTEVPDFGESRWWKSADMLQVRSDDEYNGYDYHSFAYANERFMALGGPSWLGRVPQSTEVTPAFLQGLTQVSQAWCRTSVTKQGTPILKYATLADKSPVSNDAIRKNISYLYKRMLAQAPAPADSDALFNGVYLNYEKTDTTTAWIAVCTSLIRHPLWLSY